MSVEKVKTMILQFRLMSLETKVSNLPLRVRSILESVRRGVLLLGANAFAQTILLFPLFLGYSSIYAAFSLLATAVAVLSLSIAQGQVMELLGYVLDDGSDFESPAQLRQKLEQAQAVVRDLKAELEKRERSTQ
ncbi:hypothetical protein [Myxococcus phage Mx1]|nr:hypothetical protein [Myxococcus phage Mx1]